ncbi:MAG: DUF1565 domain-containing protein [Ktedonobacteraceae bacterium]|nr:DUF1565 domain-containing protein [Ktedonobacteraceae bacterium]
MRRWKILASIASALLLVVLGAILLVNGWSVVHRAPQGHLSARQGTSYYVSPTGSDTGVGSSGQPFATIQKAASVATAGTTVHVLPGTYTQSVYNTANGTALARITFISDVKWGAKVVTHGIRTSWTNYASYVDIQGFDITGDGDIGINDYGSYVRIIGNHVHNYAIASCGINGAAGIDDSENSGNHDNSVIGNVVDHIGPPLSTYCNLDQGIYHSTPNGYIANNIVYSIAAYGLHTWHSATGVTMVNNLVFNCGAGGIIVAANHVIPDNFLVANNIILHTHNVGIYEYGQTGIHNRYLNNLVYANPTNILVQRSTEAQGTLTVDPHLVNYQPDGSGDYHLAAGSPAIAAGTSVQTASVDINGNTRVVGKASDLGPYAYEGANIAKIVKKLIAKKKF